MPTLDQEAFTNYLNDRLSQAIDLIAADAHGGARSVAATLRSIRKDVVSDRFVVQADSLLTPPRWSVGDFVYGATEGAPLDLLIEIRQVLDGGYMTRLLAVRDSDGWCAREPGEEEEYCARQVGYAGEIARGRKWWRATAEILAAAGVDAPE